MMAENISGPPSADQSKCNSENISGDNPNKPNPPFSEETSKWLSALETYVKETEATYLDIEPKRVGVKEAAAVYTFLQNSCIVDLNISCNKLRGGMENLLRSLITTEIRTLSFCRCIFSSDELVRLMEALKDTHITELVIDDCDSDNDEAIEFDPDEGKDFISHLLKSHLTVLGFQPRFVQPVDDLFPFPPADITPLLSVLHDTSITNLDLSNTTFSIGVLTSLFSTLSRTAVTDLNLRNTEISENEVKQLSRNLKDSKLEILDLSGNDIEDCDVDILAKGLAQSKIRVLNLSETLVTGSCCLDVCLKDSQISDLNLSYNYITSENLFSFPDFLKLSSIERLEMAECHFDDQLGQKLMKSLKSSKVSYLDVECNVLTKSSIYEFTEVLKDTVISSVNFSNNFFPFDGAIKLGDCLKDSKLETVRLNRSFAACCTNPVLALSAFLEKTKGSPLSHVEMAGYNLGTDDAKDIANSLLNTTFSHLDLTDNNIGAGITSLAPKLKFTAITHLHLGHNHLGNAGVETLANCLKETEIIHLDLHNNAITDHGATLLAASLKGTNLLQLQISCNLIGNEGLEVLATHAEGTFVTTLDVAYNSGNRNSLIDRILLENRTSVHRFVNFFKRIAPESGTTNFRLEDNINDNVDVFLEECLAFYKTVMEQSSAASVLTEDENLSFSKDQIVKLLEEDFPRQFTLLVLNKIEASASQHVDFLRRADELGLTKIVEFLLLNRPALTIDQNANILHPYVYQLLRKYKQPLYNLSIEPEGKTKIIEYFMEHSNVEGAVDVLSMLCDNLAL